MVTSQFRSDAPQGDTIDEGSPGAAPSRTNPTDVGPPIDVLTPGDRGLVVSPVAAPAAQRVEVAAGTVRIEIVITVAGSTPSVVVAPRPDGGVEPERAVRPWVDDDYDNRRGYDPEFLGLEVPLPSVHKSRVALQSNGESELKYEHFSVCMHRQRRMCLLTAANLDGAPRRKRPDPTKRYTRAVLGGLGPNDTEVWFTDPRLPAHFQLPDRFFTKDQGAFDRGHVVMRESVCWGRGYTEVRRANGDTYHTTNCTPQVKGFNQASQSGRWGQLENELGKLLKQERLTVFAGPILSKDDWFFEGVDDRGDVRVQIPSCFWKVVVGLAEDRLVAFGFRLEQDLSAVPLSDELSFDPSAWSDELVAIDALDREIGDLSFPDLIKDADQFNAELGRSVTDELGVPPRGG